METRWIKWDAPWLRGLGKWDVWVSQWGFVLTRYTRTGYLLGSLGRAWLHSSVDAQVEQLQEASEELMQRRRKPADGAPSAPHAEYADLLEKLPNLAQWMTDSVFDDGEPRPGGWFCVSCRGGSWHATMKDAGEGLVYNVSAPTYLLLLDLMEHALVDPSCSWRADPGHKRPEPKRGKK